MGAAALAATAAAAAQLDPKQLVLRPSDVPAGFRAEAKTSRYLSNKAVARGGPALRDLVMRSGRVNGYLGVYRKPEGEAVRIIASSVDVCLQPGGARVMLRWHDREEQADNAVRKRRGEELYRRARANVGVEGWLYYVAAPPYSVRVIWRQGRVFAAVQTWGLPRSRTMALARAQQRRVAAMLR